MFNKKIGIFTLLLFVCLAGCGGSLPSKKDLVLATSDKTITLSTESAYTNNAHPDWVYHVSAGTYKAELQNNEGVFYKGPPNCVRACDLKERCSLTPASGGIWVPSDPNAQRPRLYWYIDADGSDPNVAKLGPVIYTLLWIGNNQINFMADDISAPALLKDIVPKQ